MTEDGWQRPSPRPGRTMNLEVGCGKCPSHLRLQPCLDGLQVHELDRRSETRVERRGDLLGVDSLKVGAVVERCEWPSSRWISGSDIPSCSSSTAYAWRSWWGANRRRTPALSARWCSSRRAAVADHARPTSRTVDHTERGPTG